MKLAKGLDLFAAKAAKKNVTKGKIRSIDFDRAVVVPDGSSGSIKGAYIVGDPDTLSVGQEVDVMFAQGRVLVMANSERSSKEYSLENHAERHAASGVDPVMPDMIGAAKESHTHTGDEIVGNIDADTFRGFFPSSFVRTIIAEIGTTNDGTDITTYPLENGWYVVGLYTTGMPVNGLWWYVEAFVTEDSSVLLRAHGTNGSEEDKQYVRRKENGIWNSGWVAVGSGTVADGSVTNAKLANMTAFTVKGRITPSTGAPQDLTASDLKYILNVSHLSGGIPLSDGTVNVNLNADMLDGYQAADFIRFAQSRGTSFPGSPSIGQQFFRTDLGFDCYWNGSYWLTANEFSYHTPYSSITSSTWLAGMAVRTDYRPYITRVNVLYVVYGTNDASNRWQILCRGLDLQLSTGDWLINFYTNIGGFSAWYSYSYNVNRVSTVNPIYWLDWATTKIGSAGQLIFTTSLFYRLVIT